MKKLFIILLIILLSFHVVATPIYSNMAQAKDSVSRETPNELSVDWTSTKGIQEVVLEISKTGSWQTVSSTFDIIEYGTIPFSEISTSSENELTEILQTNYYESQGFVAQKTNLTKIKISFDTTEGGIIKLELRPDVFNSQGVPDGQPSMDVPPLAAQEISIESSGIYDITFNTELIVGDLYHIVATSQSITDVKIKTTTSNSYPWGRRTFSNDRVLWNTIPHDWEFSTYYIEEVPTKAKISYNYSSTNSGIIEWRSRANDGSWTETEKMSFQVTGPSCPTCDDCSDWSDCTGEQVRVCYSCSGTTNYKCEPKTETRDCITDLTWLDAYEALSDARIVITGLEGVANTTEAKQLLESAETRFDSDNWKQSYDKALEAKTSALNAKPLEVVPTEEPPDRTANIIGLIFMFIAVVATIFWVRKKPVKPKHVAPMKILPKKDVCSVCGKELRGKGYKCSSCGQMTCYHHVRHHNNKNICTYCAKKKGLI